MGYAFYIAFAIGPPFIWAGVNRLRETKREGAAAAAMWGAFGITFGLAIIGAAAFVAYRLWLNKRGLTQ